MASRSRPIRCCWSGRRPTPSRTTSAAKACEGSPRDTAVAGPPREQRSDHSLRVLLKGVTSCHVRSTGVLRRFGHVWGHELNTQCFCALHPPCCLNVPRTVLTILYAITALGLPHSQGG